MFMGWGAWRPDVAGPNKGYCELAQGVVPQSAGQGIGYGPFPQLVTASGAEALSGAPRGIVSVQKFDGTWQVYAATASTIEVLDSSYQWSDVETGRTVTSGDDVSFLHYGSYLLNTDTTSEVKAYNVESPSGNNAVSTAPGNVRFLFSSDNVIFALDCDDNNRRMESSARGDHTNWTTQGADGKTFEDGGALICGGDLKNGNAIILQESAARLVQFGVGPALYAIQKIADGRGCVSARTFVAFDGAAFWWDTDGPWQFTVGGGLVPIGTEKVSRWADENIQASNYENLVAVVDPTRSLVIWRVDATYSLAYNWVLKEWSTLPMVTSTLARIATAGVTIDNLSGTIDSLNAAINNREWQGGAPVLGALDGSYKFATFTGLNAAALIEGPTSSMDREQLIQWVRPVSDAAISTLAVGTTPSLGTSLTWNTAATKQSHGWTEQRARGRNLAFREALAAGEEWSFSNGVDVGGGPK